MNPNTTSQNTSITSIIANLKGEDRQLAEEIYNFISDSETVATPHERELNRKIPQLIEKLKQLRLSDDGIYSIICSTAELAETKSRAEILSKLTGSETQLWKDFLATKPNFIQELTSLEFLSKKVLGKDFDQLINENILLALNSFEEELENEIRTFQTSETVNEDRLFTVALSKMLETLKIPGELSAAILLQKGRSQTIYIQPNHLRYVPSMQHGETDASQTPAPSQTDTNTEQSTAELPQDLQNAYQQTVVETVRQLQNEPLIPDIDETWTVEDFIDPWDRQNKTITIEDAIRLAPKPADLEKTEDSLETIEHNALAAAEIYGKDSGGRPLIQNLVNSLAYSNHLLMGEIASAIQILSPNQKTEGIEKRVVDVVTLAAAIQLSDLKTAKRFIEIVQKGGDLNEVGFKDVLGRAITRAAVEGGPIKDKDLKDSAYSAFREMFKKREAPNKILDNSAPLPALPAQRSAALEPWLGANGPFLGLAQKIERKKVADATVANNPNRGLDAQYLAGQSIANAINRLAERSKDPAAAITISLKTFRELDRAGNDAAAIEAAIAKFNQEITVAIDDQGVAAASLDTIHHYAGLRNNPAAIADELRYSSYVQLFQKMLEGEPTDQKASSDKTIRMALNHLVHGSHSIRGRVMDEMLKTILVGVVAPSLSNEQNPDLKEQKANQLKATLIAQEIAARIEGGNRTLIDEAASGNLELPKSMLVADPNSDFAREYAQVDRFKAGTTPINGDYNERAKNWLNEVKAAGAETKNDAKPAAVADSQPKSSGGEAEKKKDGAGKKPETKEKAAEQTDLTARALFTAVSNRIEGEKQTGRLFNQDMVPRGVEETVAIIKLMDSRNPELKTPQGIWDRAKILLKSPEFYSGLTKKVVLTGLFATISVVATASGASALAAGIVGIAALASSVKGGADIIRNYQKVENSRKLEYGIKNAVAFAGGMALSAAFGSPANDIWQAGIQIILRTAIPTMAIEAYGLVEGDSYQKGFVEVLKEVQEYDKRVVDYIQTKASRRDLENIAVVLKIPEEQLKDTKDEIAKQVLDARSKMQALMVERPTTSDKTNEVEQILRNLDDLLSVNPEIQEQPQKIFTALGQQAAIIRQRESESMDLVKAQGIGAMLMPTINVARSFFDGGIRLPENPLNRDPQLTEAQLNTKLQQANFGESIKASSFVSQGGQNVLGVDLNNDGIVDIIQTGPETYAINTGSPSAAEALRAHYAVTHSVNHETVGVYPIANASATHGFQGQFAVTDSSGNLLEIVGERPDGELVTISPAEMIEALRPTLSGTESANLTPEIVVGQFTGEENARIALIYQDPAVSNSQIVSQFSSNGAMQSGEHVVAAMDILDGSRHGATIQLGSSEITEFQTLGAVDLSGGDLIVPSETVYQAGTNAAAFLAAAAGLLSVVHSDRVPDMDLPKAEKKAEEKRADGKEKKQDRADKDKVEEKPKSKDREPGQGSDSSSEGTPKTPTAPINPPPQPQAAAPAQSIQNQPKPAIGADWKQRIQELEGRIKLNNLGLAIDSHGGERLNLSVELAESDPAKYKAQLLSRFVSESTYGLQVLEALNKKFGFDSDTLVIDPKDSTSGIRSIASSTGKLKAEITVGAKPLPGDIIYKDGDFKPDEQMFKLAHEAAHAVTQLMRYDEGNLSKPLNNPITELHTSFTDARQRNNHGLSPHAYQEKYRDMGANVQADEDLVHLVTLYIISPDYLKSYLKMLSSELPEDISYKARNQIEGLSKVIQSEEGKAESDIFNAIDEGFARVGLKK